MISKNLDRAMTLIALGSVLVAVLLVTASSFYFDMKRQPAEIAGTQPADQ